MLGDKIVVAVKPTAKLNGIRLCQRVERIGSLEEKRDLASVTIEEYTRRDDIVDQFTLKVKDIPDVITALNKFKVDGRVKEKKVVRVVIMPIGKEAVNGND